MISLLTPNKYYSSSFRFLRWFYHYFCQILNIWIYCRSRCWIHSYMWIRNTFIRRVSILHYYSILTKSKQGNQLCSCEKCTTVLGRHFLLGGGGGGESCDVRGGLFEKKGSRQLHFQRQKGAHFLLISSNTRLV